MLFNPGEIVATPGALKTLEDKKINPADLLKRHFEGDFGELCKEDVKSNKESIKCQDSGALVMSIYSGIWIITHIGFDTTILLPEEY